MELTIFPKHEVSQELQKHVEVRLHLDSKELKNAAAVHEYKERVTRSNGIPIYIIVEPDSPEKVIERFDGLDLSGGEEFRKMLQRSAGTAR
jgi:hypothetical protein